MSRRARVRVPATSANLGPGFDAVGLALATYDDVTATVMDGDELVVEITGHGADSLPRDHRHLVVSAMDRAFAVLGSRRPGLLLQCSNDIPQGRGLGSSAAAVVAGVLLARELADEPGALDDAAVLAMASDMEGHADNAAAALHGGLTIAWRDVGGPPVAARLEAAETLRVVALVPATTLSTAQARGLLPSTVPHADAAYSAARAALLVHALTKDPGLLLPATDDRLHQDYRRPALPRSLALVRRLRAAGLAATVSGAGPSVLLLGGPELDQVDLSAVLDEADRQDGADDEWEILRPGVDRSGATVVPAG